MRLLFNVTITAIVILLIGCAAIQDVSEFNQKPPKKICIAEHKAVKIGVLSALIEGFNSHGADTKIINATYEEKHKMWYPRVCPNQLGGCDAIAFYVANWAWDISLYMYFANIWITDVSMSRNMAQATYQTGGGLDKWIDAREKILELVNDMYKNVAQGQSITHKK